MLLSPTPALFTPATYTSYVDPDSEINRGVICYLEQVLSVDYFVCSCVCLFAHLSVHQFTPKGLIDLQRKYWFWVFSFLYWGHWGLTILFFFLFEDKVFFLCVDYWLQIQRKSSSVFCDDKTFNFINAKKKTIHGKRKRISVLEAGILFSISLSYEWKRYSCHKFCQTSYISPNILQGNLFHLYCS